MEYSWWRALCLRVRGNVCYSRSRLDNRRHCRCRRSVQWRNRQFSLEYYRRFIQEHPRGIDVACRDCELRAAVGRHWVGPRVRCFPPISAIFPCISARSAKPSCQLERCVAGVICTAVTLYSGQLVAQSLYSVATTFAPVSGLWKVV